MKSTWAEQFVFLLAVGAIFLWAAIEAQGFPSRARIFPQTVALLAVVLATAEVARMLRRRTGAEASGTAADRSPTHGSGATRARSSDAAHAARDATEAAPGEAEDGHEDNGFPTARAQWRTAIPYLVSMAAFVGAIWLLGVVPAAFLFVVGFLIRFGEVRWTRALFAAAVFTAVLTGIISALELALPEGWVVRWR